MVLQHSIEIPCLPKRDAKQVVWIVFQVIFNRISAAEMAALPKDLKLDLLAEFQFLPGDLESLEAEKFGKVSRVGRSCLRYRSRAFRIYF